MTRLWCFGREKATGRTRPEPFDPRRYSFTFYRSTARWTRGGTEVKVIGLTRATTMVVSVVVAAAVLASCSPATVTPSASSASGSSSHSGPSGGGPRQHGGTATWAEAPGARPDYIFPFMNLAYFTVANVKQFQYLLYRPLYWFGTQGQPTLDPSLSLAAAPVYSNGNTTVVVKLKPYKWSDGETVTAQDVMFWMNMMHADKANWAAYAPSFIPDNIKGITVDSADQLTFTLDAPVNPQWFTDDQLSQITPFPVAWDITATGAVAGSGGCSTAAFGQADAKCNAVYTFLSTQAGYDPASSPPTALCRHTPPMRCGRSSTGPGSSRRSTTPGTPASSRTRTTPDPRGPSLAKFVEVPFATEDDEYTALTNKRLTFGYLPLSRVTKPTTNPITPTGYSPRLSGYYLAPLYTWSVDYFPENFNSTGDGGNAGNIWKQLYFRQAFQDLIDQPGAIAKADKGFGVPTYGPVPLTPASPFASRLEENNPYPYRVSKAKALLTSHGWTVVPNGTTSCTASRDRRRSVWEGHSRRRPPRVQPGIRERGSLDREPHADGEGFVGPGRDQRHDQRGPVRHRDRGLPRRANRGRPAPGTSTNLGCGWVYTPDYYPTGEENLSTTAAANSGSLPQRDQRSASSSRATPPPCR